MFVLVVIVGVVLLVTSLVFDDWLDQLEPNIEYVSGVVVGAFLAGFGGLGWIVLTTFDTAHGLVGLGAALVGGLVAGWAATEFVRQRDRPDSSGDGTGPTRGDDPT